MTVGRAVGEIPGVGEVADEASESSGSWSCVAGAGLRRHEALAWNLDGPAARRRLRRLHRPAGRGRIDRLRRPADRPGPAPVRRVLRRPEQVERLPRRRDRGHRAGGRGPARAASAGFRGLAWSPDGYRLFASTDKGHVQAFRLVDGPARRRPEDRVSTRRGAAGNPVPGGMAITRDGTRLFVAAANRNAVVEIDLATEQPCRASSRSQNLPFEPRLTEDERTLVVSNWGGRLPRPGRARPPRAHDLDLVVDERGASASGTVSLIDLRDRARPGTSRSASTPRPSPSSGRRAYVANAMSDSVSEIDLDAASGRPARSRSGGATSASSAACPTPWPSGARRSTSPTAATTPSPRSTSTPAQVRGFRHAGFFPVGRRPESPTARSAFVLNTKGNGSVSKTIARQAGQRPRLPGDGHRRRPDRRPRRRDRRSSPATTAGTPARAGRRLKVYNGAIKHVLYIIKENRTYDEVFGDLPQGNGDPKLCSLGEKVMPNHRKLAREFTLFDNGYVLRHQQRRRPRLVHAGDRQRLPRTLLRRLLADLPRRRRRRRWRSPTPARSGTPPLKKGKIAPRLGRVLRRRAGPVRARSRRTGSRSGRTASRGTQQVQVHGRHDRRRA